MIQVGGKVLRAKKEKEKRAAVFRPISTNKSNQRNVKLADPHLGSGELSPNMAFCVYCREMNHTGRHAGLL